MKLYKIFTGVLLTMALTTSVAFAAHDGDKPYKGPVYKMVNRMLERRIDMDIEEVKMHLENRDLKATLEAEGYDVNEMQEDILDRVSGFLGHHDVTLVITHTEDGAEVRLYSDNEKFLMRGMILEARANYFNLVHEGEANTPTLEGGNDEESLYLKIVGENQEEVEAIQYRMPEYNTESAQ